MAAINPRVAYAHVAIYTRISKDKYGNAETCTDQEEWGYEYAAIHWPGLPVVVYTDPDMSAFKDDVYRPGFEALKDSLRAGLVLQLWSVEQSRLERKEVAWFTLAAILDGAGIELLHTRRDGVIRVQDEVAGIKAVLNAAEIRKMKKRIADKADKHAARGLPPGSRPFGFVHGKTEAGERTYLPVPEQATAIQDAAVLVKTGWSLENIARLIRNRGVHGAHRVKTRDENSDVVLDAMGNPVTRWSEITGQAVKKWFKSAAVAGIRIHRGTEIGMGNWEPILEEKEWREVRAILSSPRDVTMSNGRTYRVSEKHSGPGRGRRYLLTGGTALCAVCEGELIGTEKQLRNKSRGVYTKPYLVCHPRGGGKGCVGVMLPETEDFVVGALLDEIKRRVVHGIIDDGGVGERRELLAVELSGLEGQRRELATMWAGKKISGVEWAAARAGLDTEQFRLEAELRQLPMSPQTRAPSAVIDDWVDMNLDERRAVIKDYIKSVTVHRATPGLQRFDNTRIKVEWRERHITAAVLA